jgi:NitT/TauT family transport system ATP-binding protein
MGCAITVRIEGLSKVFTSPTGAVHALAPTTLEVHDHEFVCVVGPSGCGKTTLLRILAGILRPTAGTFVIGPAGAGAREPSVDRVPTAMVFQDHGLFPWMDVLDNVAFGLEAQGVDRSTRRAAARQLVENLGLSGFTEAFPNQLSGGMRQRVGIARALLTDPQVLLMDEPFGALDAQTKLLLQEDLLRVWRESRKEVIYVTHDLDEAIRLGDRIVVMSGRPGQILADIEVPLQRPRHHLHEVDARAQRIRDQVWGLLVDEVRLQVERGA